VKQSAVTVVVTGCLIATATFESELSPEVQFLRDFRDSQILQTFAGSNFMTAFNAWYYSFSPTVANYISTHETARTGMKYALYPLMGILHASSTTFSALSIAPELAAIVAGMVASSLIGIVYLALPLTGILWVFRRRLSRTAMRTAAKWLSGTLAMLVVAFALSEFVAMAPIAMLLSVGIMLTALTMGSLLPALTIVRFGKRGR
jgi:peptide/nickel transport system substrate-binding protein